MKKLLTALVFLAGISLFAQRPPSFAKADRILTVEHWTRHEAIVWAVQPDRIVVYRIFDTLEPDVLLSEQLITPEQQKKIRDAISAIPSDSYGMLFWEGGLTHGPFLRLSFTSDGSFAERRIEFCGVFENWLRALCSAVSEPMTTEKKIEFEAAVKARRERLAKIGFVPPMLRTPIAEFYGPPRAEKNSPNQALEPTSTAVTPPAVAGDRASGTRGSP